MGGNRSRSSGDSIDSYNSANSELNFLQIRIFIPPLMVQMHRRE
jgi:hypothetical protein